MKNHYEKPDLDFLEVEVEQGFAGSLAAGGENGGWVTCSRPDYSQEEY